MSTTTWLAEKRRFLVVERVDSCGADGVRRVAFKLATSEIPDIEIPEFQAIQKDDPVSELLSTLGLPAGEGGMPGDGGSTLPSCCDDNATAATDVDEPSGVFA